jgi:signal transduction histidine kinase
MPEAVKQGLVATAAGHDSELSTAGLGLYSTATWIRTLGGTIRVGDRESGGTVVTVTLPAAESTRNGRERPAPQDR